VIRMASDTPQLRDGVPLTAIIYRTFDVDRTFVTASAKSFFSDIQ